MHFFLVQRSSKLWPLDQWYYVLTSWAFFNLPILLPTSSFKYVLMLHVCSSNKRTNTFSIKILSSNYKIKINDKNQNSSWWCYRMSNHDTLESLEIKLKWVLKIKRGRCKYNNQTKNINIYSTMQKIGIHQW